MSNIEVYKNKIVNKSNELQNYFYGIVRNNDNGSKTCCGYLQDSTDIITFYSDNTNDNEQSIQIMNYGTYLSFKMIQRYGDGIEFINYMVKTINECANLEFQDIAKKLSHIGNVNPEWKVEKFGDLSSVFSRLKEGESLGKILGATAYNYTHHPNAVEQEPTFNSDIEKEEQNNISGKSI